MTYFRIRRLSDREVMPGIPTPFLISQGGGEAYFEPGTNLRGEDSGVWYAKAPGYASPDGTYTRVAIEHLDDYRVDVEIQPTSESDEEVEAYDDFFFVKAASESEAFRLAEAQAHEEVERQYGDEYGSIVTIILARKGVI